MSGVIAWIIFLALGGIAIVTAASMLITMSMYRAGLALMASFVALAGIFILLDADLPFAIQIMMNVGGMMMMVLFMVMLMMDPGGEMMWGMKRSMRMSGLGAFSMHMPSGKPPSDDDEHASQSHQQAYAQGHAQGHAQIDGQANEQSMHTTYRCPMHPEVQQDTPGRCPICGMNLVPVQSGQQSNQHQQHHQQMSDMAGMSHNAQGSENDHDDMSGMDMGDMDMGHMTPRQNYQMMADMAMSTAQLPWALALGVVAAAALIALAVLTPWPISSAVPTQNASLAVGDLLLGRYMIGFEGAAFLIVGGIAGAVLLGRREGDPPTPPAMPQQHTHPKGDEQQAKQQLYTCPMHPEVREPAPGQCPKCGMNLIPPQLPEASRGNDHDHGHGAHSQEAEHQDEQREPQQTGEAQA